MLLFNQGTSRRHARSCPSPAPEIHQQNGKMLDILGPSCPIQNVALKSQVISSPASWLSLPGTSGSHGDGPCPVLQVSDGLTCHGAVHLETLTDHGGRDQPGLGWTIKIGTSGENHGIKATQKEDMENN